MMPDLTGFEQFADGTTRRAHFVGKPGGFVVCADDVRENCYVVSVSYLRRNEVGTAGQAFLGRWCSDWAEVTELLSVFSTMPPEFAARLKITSLIHPALIRTKSHVWADVCIDPLSDWDIREMSKREPSKIQFKSLSGPRADQTQTWNVRLA
jgi:hypothetical protein